MTTNNDGGSAHNLGPRSSRPVSAIPRAENRGNTMNFTFFGRCKSTLLVWLTALFLLVSLAPQVHADETDSRTEPGDPPSRVARISFLDGSVSFQPGGTGDWGAAAKNRPVTVGDKIWSDKDSRVELQVGQAAIHVGSMTAVSFLNLDENIMQLRLAEGAVNFRIRELREGDLYEVDTPNLAFTVKEAGAFRIDVTENGDATRITVIRGEGEVTADGKTYGLHPGEQAEFEGVENVQYHTSSAPPPDGLDRWAADRDLREDRSTSAKYVSRDVPGYSDLDDYGTWSEQPDYGPVWYPTTVAVGWAPYSWGYWNWVGPWGWTWVDYAPWGFAPFHYGRWAFIGGRWGWCPGPVFARPVFGPAFVGFFGGPHFGFSVGFGGGGVGWFPLGFGEPFFPWFRCGRGFAERINVHNTFIRNVNIVHTTNIHNFNFVNAHNVNAVTVASRSTFVNGQAISRNAVHVNAASLRGAQVTNNVGFSPTRQSSIGAVNARAHLATPPASVQARSVMARTAPAAAASRMPVHTMNVSNLTPTRMNNTPANNLRTRGSFTGNGSNRPGNTPTGNNAATFNRPGGDRSATFSHPGSNSGMPSARQNQLSQNRPPSAGTGFGNRGSFNVTPNNASQNRPTNTPSNTMRGRTWDAQGNMTDRGQAPQGFGRSNGSQNNGALSARMNRSDRPPGTGSGATNSDNYGMHSSNPGNGGNRPSYGQTYSNGGRSYQPPSRSISPPSRSYSAPRSSYPSSPSYSAPSRSYSPPSRSYSAPSYSAPSHNYSAPSRSYGGGGSYGGGYHGGGGGGSYHGGGGGGGYSHGGGGVSHGGGGGRH
jgi:hypothetical protein